MKFLFWYYFLNQSPVSKKTFSTMSQGMNNELIDQENDTLEASLEHGNFFDEENQVNGRPESQPFIQSQPSLLERSRNLTFKKHEHFVYSVIISVLGLGFAIFGLTTFIYHVVSLVMNSKSRSIPYWIVMFVCDVLGFLKFRNFNFHRNACWRTWIFDNCFL
jgi:hypothetical protein